MYAAIRRYKDTKNIFPDNIIQDIVKIAIKKITLFEILHKNDIFSVSNIADKKNLRNFMK